MDFRSFLCHDLIYIKINLSLKILQKKNCTYLKRTILHCVLFENKDLEIIQYVFDFTLKNNKKLFLEKDSTRRTIIHYVLQYVRELEIIQYVFNFTKLNCSELFLEKSLRKQTFLHLSLIYSTNLKTIKYVFDFAKKFFPDLFLENDYISQTILFYSSYYNSSKNTFYCFRFLRNNVPEIITDKDYKKYYSKNNLSLPLTFQIQN